MTAVIPWMKKYKPPRPNVDSAICDTTVDFSLGVIPYQYASSVMPAEHQTEDASHQHQGFGGVFSAGALKFGMAFDTASTPVSAEQPELKALSNRNRLTLETAEPISGISA